MVVRSDLRINYSAVTADTRSASLRGSLDIRTKITANRLNNHVGYTRMSFQPKDGYYNDSETIAVIQPNYSVQRLMM
jgi:hypothetical protein